MKKYKKEELPRGWVIDYSNVYYSELNRQPLKSKKLKKSGKTKN